MGYPLPENNDIVLMSQPSDVTLNQPIISYDSQTNHWIVTGGGYWRNTSWFNDVNNIWWGYIGETKNVGNYDSVGITYYNTSGTHNCTVLSSYGYWTDHNGWTEESHNPSYGDGLGVAFDYQDIIRRKKWGGWVDPADTTYLGDGFAASITYDYNFVNYNEYARTFYVHTWETAQINSITFGGHGTTFGVNISITNSRYSFKAFNDSDAHF